MIAAEYLLLGGISGVAGTALGLGATWGLSIYFFGTPAVISVAPVLAILFIVIAATVLAGAIGCWGIFQRSPLEALRAEA